MTQPVNAKRRLRHALTVARTRRTEAQQAADREALPGVLLEAAELRAASTVAAFWPGAGEPDITMLLAHLHAAGTAVLLPVLRADDDLDWCRWHPGQEFRTGRRGVAEPAGSLLGRDAVRAAEVLLVPGLAVDPSGRRLGRGGGSYDRVLARLSPHQFAVVVLHEGEVVDEVPAEAHDRPVHAAATAAGLLRCTGTSPSP